MSFLFGKKKQTQESEADVLTVKKELMECDYGILSACQVGRKAALRSNNPDGGKMWFDYMMKTYNKTKEIKSVSYTHLRAHETS